MLFRFQIQISNGTLQVKELQMLQTQRLTKMLQQNII